MKVPPFSNGLQYDREKYCERKIILLIVFSLKFYIKTDD